jgi:hypothetical protein
VSSLTEEQRRTATLFLDERVIVAGTPLGLEHEGIRVRSPRAVLVFVDFRPLANFAHECRYLLFHPDTAERLEEYEAKFPPYPRGWPRTYRRFDEKRISPLHLYWNWLWFLIQRVARQIADSLGKTFNQPVPSQVSGRRFAILFAGVPDPCHLNAMELAYRTLLDRQFQEEDILVACYQGPPGPYCPKWVGSAGPHEWPGGKPGDKAFKMKVQYPGNQWGFQQAINALKLKQPGAGDLLFIYVSGHGNGPANGGQGSVVIETLGGSYSVSKFSTDLKALLDPQVQGPALKNLVVLMTQCCAGGFATVSQLGIAASTAFAAASPWDDVSNNDGANDLDYSWVSFATDWFAMQAGVYFDNRAFDPIVATILPGFPGVPVTTKAAFDYSNNKPPGDPADHPVEDYSSIPAAQLITLDG